MQNSALDLLRLSGVPEILSEISTGASGHIHLAVILISTLRALPLQIVIEFDLALVSTDLTVI